MKIWESLLRVEQVGVKDNFFDLGGHSLLATRLIAQIEKTLGKRVSLASLFQSPTIEGIAKELQEEGGKASVIDSVSNRGFQAAEEQLIQPKRKRRHSLCLSRLPSSGFGFWISCCRETPLTTFRPRFVFRVCWTSVAWSRASTQ